jgi:hypothetical protein
MQLPPTVSLTQFVVFLQSIIAANAAVGEAFVSWNVQLGDEKAGVSAGDMYVLTCPPAREGHFQY